MKKYSPIEASLLGKEIVRFATENKGEGTYTYNDFQKDLVQRLKILKKLI